MLQLSQPDELFGNQTIYRISTNVDKPAMERYACKVAVVLPQALATQPAVLKEMAEKLIAACKIDTKDVVYLDAATDDVSYQALQSNYRPQVILFFGDMLVSRNLKALKKNTPYEFNGVKILTAQTLDHIAKTPTEKSALWIGLRKLFGV